jgi:sigma-B regulation protein RsbU (phosphoserine phosphatase)
VLNELVEQARKISEPRLLIRTVSQRISEILHVPHISVLLRSGEAFRLAQALGLSLHGPILLPEGSSTIRRLARAEGPTLLYGHAVDKWIDEAGEQEKQLLEQMNAELLVPLPGRERLLGVMTLGPKQSEDAYSPSDLTLLGAIGTQTGLGLEIADLADCLAHEAAQRAAINRELEIAREVQQRLFPQSVPTIPGVSIAGFCRPAQGCGGDYYDFIELGDGRLGLAIGDVSGKGIPAALLMAGLRACLRTMTLVGPMDLAQLMERLNELIYESSAVNRYATFFFSIYDSSTRKLTYVNAGHNPPFLLREGSNGAKESIRLEAGGPVIGLLPKLAYQEQSLVLQSGDLLLTYTDGISEAMTENDEEWGEERMMLAADTVRHGCAEDVLRTVFAAADQFTGSAPQHDDMTLLVLKVCSGT